jgi:hypothetical protein
MARITELTRCAGENHFHFTIQLSSGRTIRVTRDLAQLSIDPSQDEEYLNQRLALLKREANAAGANSFAQIREYLLGKDWVE